MADQGGTAVTMGSRVSLPSSKKTEGPPKAKRECAKKLEIIRKPASVLMISSPHLCKSHEQKRCQGGIAYIGAGTRHRIKIEYPEEKNTDLTPRSNAIQPLIKPQKNVIF